MSAEASASAYADQDTVRTVSVKKEAAYYNPSISLSKTTLAAGETADIQVKWKGTLGNTLQIENSVVRAESSNSSVCAVENNTVRAVAPGTAAIRIWLYGYKEKAVEITVTVTDSTTNGGTTTGSTTSGSTTSGGTTTGSTTTGSTATTTTTTSTAEKFSKIKLSKTSYTYTGKALTPTVKVYVGSKKLSSKYYKVTYKNNKKVGYATVTIKGKGKYAKYSGTATFKILPKKETITKCKSTKKKTLTLSWKKDTQIQGYQYQICRSKKFTGSTNKTYTVWSNRKTSATVKGLSGKKTYYVRVRSFKKVNGKYLYGSWSTAKAVKVK